MAGHALRGMASAALVLVVVETFARADSGQVSGLMGTVVGLVNRALSSDVPLIPDRRTGSSGSGAPTYFGVTPQAARAGAAVANNLPAVEAITGATGGASMNQYVDGGGLPAGIANNPGIYAPIVLSPGSIPGRSAN